MLDLYLPSIMSSPGGAGVYVQSDCGNRSADDAQSLRYSRLGGQHRTHLLFRIYEVSLVSERVTYLSSFSISNIALSVRRTTAETTSAFFSFFFYSLYSVFSNKNGATSLFEWKAKINMISGRKVSRKNVCRCERVVYYSCMQSELGWK